MDGKGNSGCGKRQNFGLLILMFLFVRQIKAVVHRIIWLVKLFFLNFGVTKTVTVRHI